MNGGGDIPCQDYQYGLARTIDDKVTIGISDWFVSVTIMETANAQPPIKIFQLVPSSLMAEKSCFWILFHLRSKHEEEKIVSSVGKTKVHQVGINATSSNRSKC
jgi:hypothetical protein